MKFGVADYTMGPHLHAKFGPTRKGGWVQEPSKFKIW